MVRPPRMVAADRRTARGQLARRIPAPYDRSEAPPTGPLSASNHRLLAGIIAQVATGADAWAILSIRGLRSYSSGPPEPLRCCQRLGGSLFSCRRRLHLDGASAPGPPARPPTACRTRCLNGGELLLEGLHAGLQR